MPKRLTDTEKWVPPWFRNLPSKYKMLWLYILDNCDMAGVWYADLALAGLVIGEIWMKLKQLDFLKNKSPSVGRDGLSKTLFSSNMGNLEKKAESILVF